MSSGFSEPQGIREDVARLARHVRVRVLNCSASGCLLETTGPVPVGAFGTLRVRVGDRDFDDTIQVVRCDHLNGTESLYHVATKFLSTTPPYAGSLRYTLRCGVGNLTGWLDTKKDE